MGRAQNWNFLLGELIWYLIVGFYFFYIFGFYNGEMLLEDLSNEFFVASSLD